MNQDAAPSPLTADQMRRIQQAVANVLKQRGWGQVSLVIVKGRVVGIKTEISESLPD